MVNEHFVTGSGGDLENSYTATRVNSRKPKKSVNVPVHKNTLSLVLRIKLVVIVAKNNL